MAARNDPWLLRGDIILKFWLNVLIKDFTFIVNRLIIKNLAKATQEKCVKYALETFIQKNRLKMYSERHDFPH